MGRGKKFNKGIRNDDQIGSLYGVATILVGYNYLVEIEFNGNRIA